MRPGQVKGRFKTKKHTYLSNVITLILFSAFVSACTSSVDKRPSIVVVAVDELSVNEINCGQEVESSPKSGFSILCNESVRFTHAFTPSVLSQPAVTSILTGLYPYDHGIHTNVGKGLSPEIPVSSDIAVNSGYRTIFFSGGSPILRKSGLQKGFEIFEDNLNPTPKKLYRPFFKNVNLFNYWLGELGRKSPIFSFFYVPDLNFPESETINEYGEIRISSAEAQLDELNETIFTLIEGLKKENRWDTTWFVVVGLNGRQSPLTRVEEWPTLNVLSENTRVALFIKPPRKAKEEVSAWKSDVVISLTDLGVTFFDILSSASKQEILKQNSIQAQSLLPLLTKEENFEWNENRIVLSESGWPERLGKNIRYSARISNYLYVHDKRPLVYNTLTDRYEQSPLPSGDVNKDEILRKGVQFFASLKVFPFEGLTSAELAKYSLGYKKWSFADKKLELKQSLNEAVNNSPEDQDLVFWQARMALERRDWLLLKKIGEKAKNPVWSFVAKKNIPVNPKDPLVWPQDSCWELFAQKKASRESLKKCPSSLTLELVAWVQSGTDEERDVARERFIRHYQQLFLDQKIFEFNASLGWIWDINPTVYMGPIQADLVLSLPEMERFRDTVQKRIALF